MKRPSTASAPVLSAELREALKAAFEVDPNLDITKLVAELKTEHPIGPLTEPYDRSYDRGYDKDAYDRNYDRFDRERMPVDIIREGVINIIKPQIDAAILEEIAKRPMVKALRKNTETKEEAASSLISSGIQPVASESSTSAVLPVSSASADPALFAAKKPKLDDPGSSGTTHRP